MEARVRGLWRTPRERSRAPLRRRIAMASVLPLVAAAAVSASVYASLHSTLQTFGTVSNSAENITAATAMMRSVSDGESAIRGFALIGSPALVRRYRDAVKSFDEAADRLDPGASESASQRETIAAVRGALRNWQRHFAERIVQIRDDMPASLSALHEAKRSGRNQVVVAPVEDTVSEG